MTIEELARRSVRNADKVAKVKPRRAVVTNIYFIQMGKDGPIKIGSSGNESPERRCKDLQVGNPYPLTVLHYFRTVRALEVELHSVLSAYRIRGEWFQPHPMVIGMGNALSSLFGRFQLEANPVTEKEGFEPSFASKPRPMRPVHQRPTSDSRKGTQNRGFMSPSAVLAERCRRPRHALGDGLVPASLPPGRSARAAS